MSSLSIASPLHSPEDDISCTANIKGLSQLDGGEIGGAGAGHAVCPFGGVIAVGVAELQHASDGGHEAYRPDAILLEEVAALERFRTAANVGEED